MNDESGGLGWHAPEAIAEVLYNIPKLAGEYAILLASFLREEPFERGAHFSLVRVGPLSPDAILANAPVLTASLAAENPAIRAFACHALHLAEVNIAAQSLQTLETDTGIFNIYDFELGTMREVTVKKYLREIA